MKVLAAVALLVGMAIGPTAHAQDGVAEQATAAALRWLALCDAGDYTASWNEAASTFRAAVTQPNWETAMQSVRAPLGAVKSRTLKSADFTQSLPGAPAGVYVVVRFDTAFGNKPAAVETVTPVQDADGSWRVSGYFIK